MVYLKTVLDLSVGLIGMILLVRFTGKKTLSDLTPFDLVYILMIGGILEQVLYEEHRPITYVLWPFFVWGVLIWLIEKWTLIGDRFKHKLKGRPSVLIWNGKLNRLKIKRNHIELEQLRTLIRKQGWFSLQRVEQLILEIDGTSSIITDSEDADYLTYLLVDEGDIEVNVLKTLKKDDKWLVNELNKAGYPRITDIFYCEWSEKGGFYIRSYEETEGTFVYIDG